MTTHIIVAEDHGLYRKGLRALIMSAIPDTVVAEAACFEEFIAALSANPTADIAMIGLPLPGLISVYGLKTMREHVCRTRFAIMSGDDSRDQVLRALAAGLHGFISKRQPDHEITTAIRDILSGRIYVPASIAAVDAAPPQSSIGMMVEATNLPDRSAPRLTRRQRDVLELIAEGFSNKEIARKLSLAEPTVKIHATALMRNLGVRNRTEAALTARNVLESRRSYLQ